MEVVIKKTENVRSAVFFLRRAELCEGFLGFPEVVFVSFFFSFYSQTKLLISNTSSGEKAKKKGNFRLQTKTLAAVAIPFKLSLLLHRSLSHMTIPLHCNWLKCSWKNVGNI